MSSLRAALYSVMWIQHIEVHVQFGKSICWLWSSGWDGLECCPIALPILPVTVEAGQKLSLCDNDHSGPLGHYFPKDNLHEAHLLFCKDHGSV